MDAANTSVGFASGSSKGWTCSSTWASNIGDDGGGGSDNDDSGSGSNSDSVVDAHSAQDENNHVSDLSPKSSVTRCLMSPQSSPVPLSMFGNSDTQGDAATGMDIGTTLFLVDGEVESFSRDGAGISSLGSFLESESQGLEPKTSPGLLARGVMGES